ncbi:MAG TPA: M17 family peptidase N-terminal domain-containing protein [Rubricoccaceae bacterium]|nr:M17 family peptidase N-terminal domain-containing protein [Rubricoccaceae bacterium]
MTLSHATGALTDLAADLLVLPVRPGEVPGEWRAAFGDPLDAAAADATQTKDPSLVYTGGTAARVAVVPVGDPEELDARRVAAAKAAQLAQRLRASTLAFAIPEDEAGEAVGAYVEGVFLGAYRYVRYRTRQADLWTAPEHLLLHGAERHEEAIRRAVVGAEATNLARDLVNLSPDEKTPELLAALVREAAEAAGLRVDVWDHA